jgi:hypothetical protein
MYLNDVIVSDHDIAALSDDRASRVDEATVAKANIALHLTHLGDDSLITFL